MKLRAFLFLLTFLLGGAAGYWAGQEPAKREAKRLFNESAIRVEEWVAAALGKLPQVSAKATQGPDSPQTNEGVAVSAAPDKSEYIRQFVEISGLKAQSGAGQGSATVISGIVHNKGRHSLGRVEMTAYFMGKDGIVLDVRNSIIESAPLQPEASAPFQFQVQNVPASWIGGRVRASITDVAFVR